MASSEKDSRPTIKDVAVAAGVSVATVSNVVNGHAHVRDRTRDKVLAAIDQLGYQASRAAKSLPAGRTFLLAYGLPGGANPNPALDTFLHQIVTSASDAGLELLLFTRREGEDLTEPYTEILRRGGADGFILSDIDYGDPRVEVLRKRGIPFACFGRVEKPADVPWVDVDGAAGIRSAVRHLHELGHERITFVGWPDGSATGDNRLSGYVEEVEALELGTPTIVRGFNNFDDGRKLVSGLVDDHDPTGIVCVSDVMALGVMAGLRDMGIVPGYDVAVTGFDDVPAASLTAPALTSIRQPMERVGALLVERIAERLRREDVAASVLVEPDLIIRQSTTGATTPPTLEGKS